jgi:hypothetical protein
MGFMNQMDPAIWWNVINLDVQSPLVVPFFLFGFGMGLIAGFSAGHWVGSHAMRTGASRNLRTKRKGDEFGTLGARDIEAVDAPNDGSPAPFAPPDSSVTEAMWQKITLYLNRLGFPRELIRRLRDALESRGKDLIDPDGRPRIMIWSDGKNSSPVAMLLRSGKKPRVLFPDGSEDDISTSKLAGIPNKVFQEFT